MQDNPIFGLLEQVNLAAPTRKISEIELWHKMVVGAIGHVAASLSLSSFSTYVSPQFGGDVGIRGGAVCHIRATSSGVRP
jgi:hypothetical protein